MLKQSTWRKAGAGTVLGAAAMAVLSVPSEILRDTVVRMTQLASAEAADIAVRHPWWVIIPYWLLFTLLILLSLYFAALDLRFIRLQYALEKRRIVQDTLNSEEFRERLRASERSEE